MMKFLAKEKEILNELKDLEISKSIKIRSMLTGLLFGAVIVLLPILICVNLLLFYDYVYLLIGLITLFMIAFSALALYFNYEAMKMYDERVKNINTKYLVLIDSIYAAIMLLIIMVVVIIVLISFKII